MSFDQEYSVESYLELLIKLTGKHPEELLEQYLLNGVHPHITCKEEVVLDEGFFGPIKGTKVTLSDGTVWIPKLTQKFNDNGNHGVDYYEYCLENETPDVVYVGLDSADPQYKETDELSMGSNDGMCDDEGCGCGW